MEHERALQLLADYLQERLDEPERSGMAGHLATCAECAELAEVYELLSRAEGEEHPSSDLIVSHALRPGELGAEEAERVARHVSSCVLCAEEVRLTRGAEEGSRDLALASTGARRTAARPWIWGLPLAAAAAALLVASLVASPPTVVIPEGTGYRAAPEESVASLLSGGEAIDRASCLLRWSGPEGARYDLRVAREDLEVLVEARALSGTEFLVAEEALADLAAGSSLLWQVTAVMPDGRRLPSRTFTSRLR